jgi:hypothetical protein
MRTTTTHLIVTFTVLALAAFLLAGCFPGGQSYSEKEPAGFFSGIWHGWIAPISLIVGFFDSSIHVYEVRNTGWWYELGFYIAVISGFGGIALRRGKKKQSHQ